MAWGTRIRGAAALIALVMASGCGSEPGTGGGTGDASLAADGIAAIDSSDNDATFQRRVQKALREQRIHTPGGAIELYLSQREALRREGADDGAMRAALEELQPYLLIAIEKTLDRGDPVEGKRLVALLDRMNPEAPALPRLRDALLQADREAARRAAQVPAVGEAVAPASMPAKATADAPSSTASAVVASRPVASQPPAPIAAPAQAASPPRPAEVAARQPPAAAAVSNPSRTLLQDVPPRYPGAAANRRIQGHVNVAFTVLPDGSVADPRVASATPSGIFDEAALAAARRWRFSSGQGNVQLVRTVQFRLPE
ncbi:TonB family protein [Aerolutibacter ruishenii]|uniref:Protein TonB n=1 Tax=Aerolutibacter ruishenii TaxID=686800 RepID=A0A562LVD5_9GAMM|nr:TonB family protein [Lysobacter ruishenii]TWI11552.1 protein TonB [Lysobacter ruishenii]